METFKLTNADRLIAIRQMQEYMETNKEKVIDDRTKIIDALKDAMVKCISEQTDESQPPPRDSIENYKLIIIDEFVTISAMAYFVVDICISLAMSRREDFKVSEALKVCETFVEVFGNITEVTLADRHGLNTAFAKIMKEFHDQLHMAGRPNKDN